MPVVIPKPQPKPDFKPVDLTPAPPAGLTRAEVEAMLAERDAQWERRLSALALSLAQQPAPAPPPAPRKGADIIFKKNTKGEITGAAIVPKE